MAKYAEMTSIVAGMKFKTPSGLLVETTGKSQLIASHKINVHEVTITDGASSGQQFLFNLDYAQPV